MSSYDKLDLYEHNIESYEKVKKQFEIDNIAAIIHATGTGKSFNALQLALDNKDKKIIYVVPYASIIEHEKELIEKSNLSLEKDFPNLQFRTYQSFINMSRDEIRDLEVELLILDEFHHIGAPVWGQRINALIDSHENLRVFGMTAYTVRDRGTSYERDMTNPETDELFSNKVVSNYDLCDAMIDGVLPKPNYKSGYVFLEETCETLENKINSLDKNSKNYTELSELLKDLKKRVHEAPGLSDIFKTNIKPNGKYIYFCPINAEQGVNDIENIMSLTKKWIQEMGLSEDDYEFYATTSDMGLDGKKNRDAFYNNKDLAQNDVSNKLRIMFAINQYNEGIHTPGLDGVIMARSTQSDIVYFEQLGRALSVGNNMKEETKTLSLKNREELIEKIKQRELPYNDSMSNEELIEILVAPTIIDLSNNISFIKELENNLKDRVKERKLSSNSSNKKEIHLKNAAFNISMLNDNFFEVLRYMYDRLTMTWMDKYELAKAYYEHHGNLKIPQRFKTINGYEYDENGLALGVWISSQRLAYNGKVNHKITEEQINLLEQIGMNFGNLREESWKENYQLAQAYYEHHRNLKISAFFKTINGFEYDENGIALGRWISSQRLAYNGKGNLKITEEQINLLEQIGMNFGNLIEESWQENYQLAQAYYEHHRNLKIPGSFKTINGYEYDENGLALGAWISRQRSAYNGKGKITEEQINLLEQIGMNFGNLIEESWQENYQLAKAYYEHHGNLKIPGSFKTINGYEYDENGVALGNWISRQRSAYNGKGNLKITEEQINLLEQIGMNFGNSFEESWKENYQLAKAYYEHHGNLKIPQSFKTINGYEYDENGLALGAWISSQRLAYNGKGHAKITEEQIFLLKQIEMNFGNLIEESWQENYQLAKAYYEHHGNLKIPQSFKTINGFEYDENGVALGRWISKKRLAYNGKGDHKITKEQINLLEQIGIDWEPHSRQK